MAQTVAPHPAMDEAELLFEVENMPKTQTVVPLDISDTLAASGKATTISDDQPVRMWKPTPAGYRPRLVPKGIILLNLRNGWKRTCPDCGHDCGDDPNDCTAHEPSPVAYCPKAGCNHKINLRNLALDFTQNARAEKDPNAADLGYGKADEMTMLKAAMDAHIITRHPREARILLGLREDQERRLIPNNF